MSTVSSEKVKASRMQKTRNVTSVPGLQCLKKEKHTVTESSEATAIHAVQTRPRNSYANSVPIVPTEGMVNGKSAKAVQQAQLYAANINNTYQKPLSLSQLPPSPQQNGLAPLTKVSYSQPTAQWHLPGRCLYVYLQLVLEKLSFYSLSLRLKQKLFPNFRRASRCHLQGNVMGADVTHRVTPWGHTKGVSG